MPKGSCLCKKITFEARNMTPNLFACHCRTCRKWSGGPRLILNCSHEVSFQGKEFIKVFDSSPWAERAFCSNCGTHLYCRLKEQNIYNIPPGIFDDLSSVQFDLQIFTDEKPSYYEFANKTENMTGAEVFLKFAPPQE